MKTRGCGSLKLVWALLFCAALAPSSSTAATVAAGGGHTLVVRTTDRTLWAWGEGIHGQLGSGSLTPSAVPVQVGALKGVVAVAAGASHSIALLADGTVLAFGRNDRGQLGTGNNVDQATPVQVAELSGISAIAAGDDHSMALEAGGRVWVWGANGDGQLGDGSTTDRNAPIPVAGFSAIAIGAGAHHSLAVVGAGGLRAWGRNEAKQLGDGTDTSARNPVAVTGPRALIASVDGALSASFARGADGSAFAWGENLRHELGDGTSESRSAPAPMSELSGLAGLVAGSYHGLALTRAGAVYGWGWNRYGSVGDGTTIDRATPVPVEGLAGVADLAAGRYHSVAVTADGVVLTWGYNHQGQVGDGTRIARTAPVKISEAGFSWKVATPVFSLSAGTYSKVQRVAIACATPGATVRYTTDGTEPTETSAPYTSPVPVTVSTQLRAKGFKASLSESATTSAIYTLKAASPTFSPGGGSYRIPQTVTLSTPSRGVTLRYTTDESEPTEASTPYTGPLSVGTTTSIRARGFREGWTDSEVATANYAIARAAAVVPGTASPSSDRSPGETPLAPKEREAAPKETLGAPPAPGRAPGMVMNLTGTLHPTAASGGSSHFVIVEGDGTVIAFGANSYSALGDAGAGTGRPIPGPVSGLTDITAVAAGAYHTVARESNGDVWTWGNNGYGQLGDGTTTASDTPVPVTIVVSEDDDVDSIAAGEHHVVVARSGQAWSWGYNAYGQLGDETTTDRNEPVQVSGVEDVIQVAAGQGHSLFLKSDGTVWATGWNVDGQLGDGTTADRDEPAKVDGLSSIVAVAAGGKFSLALRDDGSVWAWGANNSYELGDGTALTRRTPVRVSGLSDVVAIRAGFSHGLALTGSGTVFAWGNNSGGQLGDGTAIARATPVAVTGLTDIGAIGAGSNASLAIDEDGSVWGWGSGSVGDGTWLQRSTPTRIAEDDFDWKVGTPTFAWPTAVYNYPFDLTVEEATPGATIHYTTNGSEPTESDATVSSGGTISLTQTRTVKAKAWKSGMPASNTAVDTYTMKVMTPEASPGGWTYTSTQSVTLSTTTSGATIRYTTNGSEPTSGSTAYSSPIAINATTTLKAKAFKSGWTDSETQTDVYTLNLGTLAAPTFGTSPGTYTTSVNVTLSGPGGATIRYTTDDTEPTAESTAYSSALTFTTTTTLKAKAFSPTYTESSTTSGIFTVKPAAPGLSPGTGSYSVGQVVTASADSGVTIRYTVGGADPEEADGVFPAGGISLVATSTVKVRGFKAGCAPSNVTSATYTISGSLPGGGVAAGLAHSAAWTSGGTVYTWGVNGSGQLGHGNWTNSLVPVALSSFTATVLELGSYHTLARTSGGTVWGWGYNVYGQLGDNTDDERESPVQTDVLTTAVAVAAGASHSVAATSGGAAYAWGLNANGQLGLGGSDTTDRDQPTQVTGLSGKTITAVAAGNAHSLALATNGKVYAWGANNYGQLGDDSTTQRTSAVEVGDDLTGLTVVAIAAGDYHSLALTSTGAVYAWGANYYGQLGDGTTTSRQVPVLVANLTGVRRIAAGTDHSLATRTDGSAWAWGYNYGGQLGNGTTGSSSVPVPVSRLVGIVSLAGGYLHSLAMDEDGAVWTWGYNGNGELGDGTQNSSLVPVKISGASHVWNVATPVLYPVSGQSFTTAQDVTVTTATSGATIYYTTNGSTPTTSDSTVTSGNTVTVGQSLTLKARAFKSGMTQSNVASETYLLNVVPPAADPGQDTYATNQSVTLSTSTSGATIRYTTDDSEPTTSSTTYTGAISVSTTLRIKAKAWKSGWEPSAEAWALYTMKVGTPQLSPSPGSYGSAQTVTVTTATSGAVLHYTTTGLEPTESDPVVASGSTVTIDRSSTLRVKGWKTGGWSTSDTTTGTYVIGLGTAATPTFSPAAGTYTAVKAVTIATTTAGSTIRYTLDGSDPTLRSPVYRAPVTVDATATLKAKAFKRNWTPSSTGSAAYTINLTNTVAPVQYSPPGGTYPTTRTVTLTTSTSGATIHYTTDGDTPTTSDPSVSSGGTVSVEEGLSLKTIGVKSGMTASPVRRADYAITGAVAGGYQHAFGLKVDGSLMGWGQNWYGQVGNDSTTSVTTPEEVLTGVFGVAAVGDGNGGHTIAVKSNGTLWGWGDNTYGVLGDGTTTQRLVPVEASNPSNYDFVAVAAGRTHTLALRDNGLVYAYGYNGYGQLGNDSTTDSTTLVQVNDLTGIVAIAAGENHSLALTAGGQVYAWGYNIDGQLGDGTTTDHDEPVLITTLAGVATIAAGGYHSMALRTDGSESGDVWVWGAPTSQPLWDLTGAITAPVRIMTGVNALSTNHGEALYLRRDGWAQGSIWGSGIHHGDKLTPGLPSITANALRIGVGDYVQISAGLYSSVALGRDTKVTSWGGEGYTGGNGLELGTSTGTDDPDGDGLATNIEWLIGTDPWIADTNGDGILDGQAVASGQSPTNTDMDGDGVTNAAELAQGTDPFRTDTDGDTYSDGADCFPLDPTRWNCPSPPGGDTTPPTITLQEPTNATLISVVPPL